MLTESPGLTDSERGERHVRIAHLEVELVGGPVVGGLVGDIAPALRVSDEDELPRTGERLHDVLPDAHGRRQASDSRCEPAIGPICSIPPSTDQEAPVT